MNRLWISDSKYLPNSISHSTFILDVNKGKSYEKFLAFIWTIHTQNANSAITLEKMKLMKWFLYEFSKETLNAYSTFLLNGILCSSCLDESAKCHKCKESVFEMARKVQKEKASEQFSNEIISSTSCFEQETRIKYIQIASTSCPISTKFG